LETEKRVYFILLVPLAILIVYLTGALMTVPSIAKLVMMVVDVEPSEALLFVGVLSGSIAVVSCFLFYANHTMWADWCREKEEMQRSLRH